ncbi:MAG TPA: pyruvate kinase [Bacteroidales bacterium]|nr:pyruvate kinase [Bacteroidales bacterium]
MSNKLSKTKIVATIGPASCTKPTLKKMIEEGTDVFRINFSHSTQKQFAELAALIKELNTETGRHIAILADLQGPKLRIGEVENNAVVLVPGDTLNIITRKCTGNRTQVYMSYQEFPRDVNAGETLLIDDGKIKLEVLSTNRKDTVKTKVIHGGTLSSHKGVNLPNTHVSLPCLTKEDISNVLFALRHGVDWIALSFVRKADDIIELKNLLKKHKSQAGIIAKIEKPEALKEIDMIIQQSDGIMVARGDLGVEMPFDEVPLIQKQLIEKSIRQSKPVIVATQMMESMITNFSPTRAEAADVANAVLDGADALMLSGETSIGRYPVETVRNMQKIIIHTETFGNLFNKIDVPDEKSHTYLADSVCYHAAELACQIRTRAIITFTHSGYTARHISANRPVSDVFVFTNVDRLMKQLSLMWGVKVFYLKSYENMEQAITESMRILREKKFLRKGERVIHVGSSPLNEHGPTNILKVSVV